MSFGGRVERKISQSLRSFEMTACLSCLCHFDLWEKSFSKRIDGTTAAPMIYLLLAIFGSGVIPVIFRAFDKFGVNLFWAIPANYVTCVLVGSLLTGNSVGVLSVTAKPWLWLAAVQGILLAVNFYLLAQTAQRAGVALAALASRLSVAIPSLLAFALYGDSLTAIKLAGLLTALMALYLCTAPEKGAGGSRLFQLLPLLVFATFGVYFTILKYLQTYYLDDSSYHSYVMSAFVFAFLSSIVIGTVKSVFSVGRFLLEAYLGGDISRRSKLRRSLCVAASLGVERLAKLAALSDLQRGRGRGERGLGGVTLSGTVVEAKNDRLGRGLDCRGAAQLLTPTSTSR